MRSTVFPKVFLTANPRGRSKSLQPAPEENPLFPSVYVWPKLHIADWHRGGIRRKSDLFLLTPGPIGAHIWWVFENRLAKGWSISNRGAVWKREWKPCSSG